MKRRATSTCGRLEGALLLAFTLAALGCGAAKPTLTRESVLPGLQKEAETLKADAERMPDLGTRSTWKIVSVDLKEQPDNAERPFRGTVRMRIETQRRDTEAPQTDAIERTFDYVYDAAAGKWTFGR